MSLRMLATAPSWQLLTSLMTSRKTTVKSQNSNSNEGGSGRASPNTGLFFLFHDSASTAWLSICSDIGCPSEMTAAFSNTAVNRILPSKGRAIRKRSATFVPISQYLFCNAYVYIYTYIGLCLYLHRRICTQKFYEVKWCLMMSCVQLCTFQCWSHY